MRNPSALVLALTLAAAGSIPAVTAAQDPGSAGGGPARGTLKVRVTVTGQGRLPGKASMWDSISWKARQTASFETRLVTAGAGGPDQAGGGAMAQAAGRPGAMSADEAQAILDKYDAKEEACGEDEACEDRLQAEKVADPKYQIALQTAMSASANVQQVAQAVNMATGLRVWLQDPSDPSAGTGSVRVEQNEVRFGAASGSEGGGREDLSQTWVGSASPVLGAELRTDDAAKTYELALDRLAGVGLVGAQDCGPSHPAGPCRGELHPDGTPQDQAIPFLGKEPPKGKDWKTALTATGPLPAAGRPLSGRMAFTANLGSWNDPTYDMPVQVTVEWSFTPGS